MSYSEKSTGGVDVKQLTGKICSVINASWKESGMKKGELAAKSKLSRASITKILAGKQLPQLPALYMLCDILNLELTDVLPKFDEVCVQKQTKIFLPEEMKSFLPEKSIRAIEGDNF